MHKTLQGKSEPDLAAFQTVQKGNSCTFHAISVSLKLLLDYSIDPDELSEEVNRLWWRGRFMRIAPDWAVTPHMLTRIVQYLAVKHHLPVKAAYKKSDPASLVTLLRDPGCECVPVITLIWLWGKAPPIYLGNSTRNFNASRSAGGHSMILAAHDPEHWAQGQFLTPWGFINPWKANTTQLFWMTDADFRKAWRFKVPRNGPNPLVLIERVDDTLY